MSPAPIWVVAVTSVRFRLSLVAAASLACMVACGSSSQSFPSGGGSGGGGGSSGSCSTTGDSCDVCISQSCCAEEQGCTGDCQSLIECLGNCADGDMSCDDNCTSSYGDGVTAAQSFLTCAENSCTGSCGGVGTDAGTGSTVPTSITIVGDSSNGIPELTVTSVTCNPGVNVTFPFPSYEQYSGLTTYIVAGDSENSPRIVVEAGAGLLYWSGGPSVSYPTSGTATIAPLTLTSENSFAPGTVTISGSYNCN
jgi:hypothetical protein